MKTKEANPIIQVRKGNEGGGSRNGKGSLINQYSGVNVMGVSNTSLSPLLSYRKCFILEKFHGGGVEPLSHAPPSYWPHKEAFPSYDSNVSH